MADEPEPGIHELFTTLLRLERRERFVRERLGLLRERAGTYPNEVTLRQQADLTAEHETLREQIAALRERLNVT